MIASLERMSFAFSFDANNTMFCFLHGNVPFLRVGHIIITDNYICVLFLRKYTDHKAMFAKRCRYKAVFLNISRLGLNHENSEKFKSATISSPMVPINVRYNSDSLYIVCNTVCIF